MLCNHVMPSCEYSVGVQKTCTSGVARAVPFCTVRVLGAHSILPNEKRYYPTFVSTVGWCLSMSIGSASSRKSRYGMARRETVIARTSRIPIGITSPARRCGYGEVPSVVYIVRIRRDHKLSKAPQSYFYAKVERPIRHRDACAHMVT
ncbi:uncharacterized protein LOC105425486 [Pogonomyrmex barbatus]|uniref:Uncharacterized protein LOC105425486 n=1 Tax=Pogonomyrmex barbatus TaxID=144034 RepID=A0A6I9W7G3_9HYME|nr:uncharacterized protein LOC105425486 [Pogonomyrmex barbatus]